MLVPIPMELDEELSLVPLSCSFDSPELPFPECRLGRKTTKHNGHLHGHQHSKQTKNDDKECKNPSNSLPGEQKPNGPYEDGVRGEIVRQQAVVIPNSRRPELNKISVGGVRIYFIHACRRSIPSSLFDVDLPLFVASQRSSHRLEPQILNRISRNGSRVLLPFPGCAEANPGVSFCQELVYGAGTGRGGELAGLLRSKPDELPRFFLHAIARKPSFSVSEHFSFAASSPDAQTSFAPSATHLLRPPNAFSRSGSSVG